MKDGALGHSNAALGKRRLGTQWGVLVHHPRRSLGASLGYTTYTRGWTPRGQEGSVIGAVLGVRDVNGSPSDEQFKSIKV